LLLLKEENIMKDSCPLENKHCVPCKGGVLPLGLEETKRLLMQLQSDWQVNELGRLYKCYKFKDFISAIEFVNKIAVIAEKEGHHPDLTISWGSCSVQIWTHKINGLTESDFILAAKIEAIV
jgi:4a-hydroxytetrahydrobiopterin dehydratase